MSEANKLVADVSEALCGALSDLGYAYEIEFDNRGGNRSRYIFVRKPVSAKIRVSDHPSARAQKDQKKSRTLVLDVGVGRHGISWQEAVTALKAREAQSGTA